MALFDKNKKLRRALAEYYNTIQQRDSTTSALLHEVYPRGKDEFVYVGVMLNHFSLWDRSEPEKLHQLLEGYAGAKELYDTTNGDLVRCFRFLKENDVDYITDILQIILCAKETPDLKADPSSEKIRMDNARRTVNAAFDRERERLAKEQRIRMIHNYEHALVECNFDYDSKYSPAYAEMFLILREIIDRKLSVREIVQMYSELRLIVKDNRIRGVDIIKAQESSMVAICNNAKYLTLQDRKALAFAMELVFAHKRPNPKALISKEFVLEKMKEDEARHSEKYNIQDNSIEFTGKDLKELEKQGYKTEQEMIMHMSITLKDGRPASIHTYRVRATIPDGDGLDDRNYVYTISPRPELM